MPVRKRLKTNQKTLTDLWENIKYIHIHEMGDTGEKRQELKTIWRNHGGKLYRFDGGNKICRFKKLNKPQAGKHKKSHTWTYQSWTAESQRKRENLESWNKKKYKTLISKREPIILLKADFLSETVETINQDIFRVLKERKTVNQIVYIQKN